MENKFAGTYNSPRVSGEILDCSMPMTFDQYSNCGFNCMYCFSTFQRGIGNSKDNYYQKRIKAVNVEKIKDIFTLKRKSIFSQLIKEKRPLQWGGLSDPMCPLEEKYRVGLELLKFFREINYPVNFSTKSDLILRDKRYQDVFRGAKNFWVKVTIISLDPEKSAKIEKGVVSPQRRLEVLKKFHELGVRTTLRLRPFIIGLSEKTAVDLIKQASSVGVESLSTEFFCLEARANANTKLKYAEMSDVLGFNIFEFYKKFSNGAGYLRLNRTIKRKYVDLMERACKEVGMKFYVSDAHFKERCHNGACCGIPNDDPIWGNYCRQFTEAIVIARKNGSVKFSDIVQGFEWTKDFKWQSAEGFNTGNTYKREKNFNLSMFQWIRNIWNNPNSQKSPYKYFGGVLIPTGKDENGDIIYKYVAK